jgi:hypothetical protein
MTAKISTNTSVYGNFSKDISFRITFSKINAAGGHSTYSPENIIQGEAGIKYGKGVFQERQQLFSLNLSDEETLHFK